MKAKLIDGKIARFQEIPENYMNIIGFNLLSEAEHQKHGFFDLVKPDIDPEIEEYGECFFDKENKVFTYTVIAKNITVAELIEKKVAELKRMANARLSATDWYVIRKFDRGVEIPAEIVEQRATIVRLSNEFEKAIKLLVTLKEVSTYIIEM